MMMYYTIFSARDIEKEDDDGEGGLARRMNDHDKAAEERNMIGAQLQFRVTQ